MSELFPHPQLSRPITERQSNSPLTIDAKQLAKLLSVGLRSIRSWDVAGKLPAPVRIGGRVLWRTDEIHAWVNADCPDRQTWTARRATVRR